MSLVAPFDGVFCSQQDDNVRFSFIDADTLIHAEDGNRKKNRKEILEKNVVIKIKKTHRRLFVRDTCCSLMAKELQLSVHRGQKGKGKREGKVPTSDAAVTWTRCQ